MPYRGFESLPLRVVARQQRVDFVLSDERLVSSQRPAGSAAAPSKVIAVLGITRRLRPVVALMRYAKAGADVRSGLMLVALRFRHDRNAGRGIASVRVRALGGSEFHLRRGTSDILAFGDNYVAHFNAPPEEVRGRDLRQILELGTNIGAGLADFAHTYPSARIVGVEPDPGNAALAQRNTVTVADRVTVVRAAVWDVACELTLEGDVEYGRMVREVRSDDPADAPRVSALPVSAILDRHMPQGEIDYVLLSAERSERRILTRNNDWLQRVRAIRVETYLDGDYTPQDTVADLQRAGFIARTESSLFGDSAVGLRPETDSRRTLA